MKEPFDQKTTVFLIDGSSFLYRAYFGLPPLNTPAGEPIRVTFGFTRILKKFIDEFNPSFLAVAWDPPSEVSQWRKKLYPAYKAQRPAVPQEINNQRALVKEVCSSLGIAQFELPDEEADDILYSLAKDLSQRKYCVVIVTQDKDFHQVIGKSIITYDPFNQYCLDLDGVYKRYQLPPKKLTFYYALVGDASDNVPGVPGIGPHEAQALVASHSSLTALYKNLTQLTNEKAQALLQAHKRSAFMSQKLVRLRYHDFHPSLKKLSFSKKNWLQAFTLFKKLGFTSLLKELEKDLND